MYKAHMTHFGKSTKTMTHLKFNVSLAKGFITGHVGSTPTKHNDGKGFYTQSWGGYIIPCNGQEHQGEEGCVWCVKRK